MRIEPSNCSLEVIKSDALTNCAMGAILHVNRGKQISISCNMIDHLVRLIGFQRLPPARGGTAQKKIIHLANWSQLIHPGPASSLTKFFFGVESVMRVNADSLLIRAAATSTSGTLNDLTTDLIMANNNKAQISA